MENELDNGLDIANQVERVSNAEAEIKYRVTYLSGAVLVGIALISDILELLGTYFGFVVLGVAASIFGAIVLGIAFEILGIDYTSNTRLFFTGFTTFAGELIPGLDAFPAFFLWTAGVILICTLVRMEDRGQKPTIIGAFGRIATVATGPLGLITRYPIQKTRDIRFQNERTNLIRRRNEEIAANPDKEEFIRKKFSGLMTGMQEKSLSPLERRVDKIAEIDKENGIKFKGGANVLNLKEMLNQSRNVGEVGSQLGSVKTPPKPGAH